MADQSCEIERLLTLLRTDDPPVDPEVLERVIEELRMRDIADVGKALASGLRDADADYRCTLANVFLACDFAAALPHAAALLLDEDEDVRGFVCQELGACGRREAVPFLIDALANDADATNRAWAAWGLGRIGDPAALTTLRSAMQNDAGEDYEGRPVKEIAAEAIRRIMEEKAAATVA